MVATSRWTPGGASSALRARYPGLKFGCGGFYEWSYIQRIIDRCGAAASSMASLIRRFAFEKSPSS